jgi:hypothetical protein
MSMRITGMVLMPAIGVYVLLKRNKKLKKEKKGMFTNLHGS